MGRRPGMTLERRHIAIGMMTAGMSARDVARHVGVHESTISRLRVRYQLTGNVKDRPRSGRPRKTTPREERYIVTTSRRNRFMSSRKLAGHLRNATGTRVCDRTIRNRLRAARLHWRRPYVGIPLTLRHRQARVVWARIHQRWIRRQWNNVLFTDESRFNLSFADGRIRVWRRAGERLDPANVIQRDRYGGGSVMVWAGICQHGKTELVTIAGNLNAVRYCNEIVEPVVIPFMRAGHATLFQQDNARPHTARYTQAVLHRNNVAVLEWPARSPDLSPIEHMWDCIGRKVRERNDVNDLRDMDRALHEEWNRIPLQAVRKLIASMRRRCIAVQAVNGGHTRYWLRCDFRSGPLLDLTSWITSINCCVCFKLLKLNW